MTEKETQNAEFDLQSLMGSSNLRRLLDNVYKDKPVVVQFECGNFIKKAIGCLNIVSCGLKLSALNVKPLKKQMPLDWLSPLIESAV